MRKLCVVMMLLAMSLGSCYQENLPGEAPSVERSSTQPETRIGIPKCRFIWVGGCKYLYCSYGYGTSMAPIQQSRQSDNFQVNWHCVPKNADVSNVE